MATEDPDILKHLGEASELCGTAEANIIGGTSEARICELGVLHALIALCLLIRQGQERERLGSFTYGNPPPAPGDVPGRCLDYSDPPPAAGV